ncbi:hypothetical protein IQ266_27695, partial [filamentous cyanobacterium LEGE 11480]
SMARQNNDTPWKKILRLYFPQAIQFFFPELAQTINWRKPPEFLDKELEQIVPKADQGNRYVDKLVRVWNLDDTRQWLLIHLEVQARKESEFPFRMLIYSNRILDRYGILATSLAILCDNSPTWRPTTCELTAPFTRHHFEFGTTKLLDYKTQEPTITQSPNPFAWITLAHLKTQATRSDPHTRKTWKFALMRQLYDRGMSGPDIRNLYEFVDWTMMLPEDLETEFWQELKAFEEQQNVTYVTNAERIGKEIGKQEGRQEGAAETATAIALKMLKKQMDLGTIAEVTDLPIEQIQRLQAELNPN